MTEDVTCKPFLKWIFKKMLNNPETTYDEL